jgi:hypothetical protein
MAMISAIRPAPAFDSRRYSLSQSDGRTVTTGTVPRIRKTKRWLCDNDELVSNTVPRTRISRRVGRGAINNCVMIVAVRPV